MAIGSSTREKLSWLVLESVLIVISILLAFWIDAAWEDFQRAEHEERLLTSITSDLESNREQLTTVIDARTLGTEALKSFLAMSPGELEVLPSDDASRLLRRMLIGNTFNAYDGAMRSDEISIISADEIRNGLHQWIGLVNNLNEDLQEILAGGQNVGQSMDVNTLIALGGFETPDETITANEILRRLRDDEDFLNARLNRQRSLDVNNRKARELLEHTDKLLDLINN